MRSGALPDPECTLDIVGAWNADGQREENKDVNVIKQHEGDEAQSEVQNI